MKTILVPVEPSDQLASTLETACVVARACGSHIEGFALRPALASFIVADPFSGATVAGADWDDTQLTDESRQLFEGFMRARGLIPSGPVSAGPSFRFNEEAPPGDGFVGSHGRIFDLIVVGQPRPRAPSPRMSTLETALFESGRPILIAPAHVPGRLGETVVIAWNGSTETARTIALALPLLRVAVRVLVLTVEGGGVPGPTGDQVRRYLGANGIGSEGRALGAGKRSPGEMLLAEATAFGCDLLIKGAYTQSRLRQMIFGGVTSHVLAAATMPVFMAH